MERLIAAVRAAAQRIIDDRRYVAIDEATDIVVHDTDPRLEELLELEAAIGASAEARRAVGFVGDQPVPAGYGVGFMVRWLTEYRDAVNHLRELEEGPAEELLERLRDFCMRDSFPAVVLTPIHRLEVAEARVQIDERTDLVVIREDRDVRRAFDRTFHIPWGAMEMLQPANVALRQQVELPREGAVEFKGAFDRAELFLAALRLSGMTGLSAGAHVVEARPPAFFLPATLTKAIRMGRTGVSSAVELGPPVELPDVGLVRERFAVLDGSDDATLRFAVRRFNDADERARAEDVIVDCWSALEALFAGGATSEITYRLSLRAANVLRTTTDERVELFRRIKRLYGTRSKVVHGGQVTRQRLADDAAESKELLRAAILAWLESGGYDSDTLDELLLT